MKAKWLATMAILIALALGAGATEKTGDQHWDMMWKPKPGKLRREGSRIHHDAGGDHPAAAHRTPALRRHAAAVARIARLHARTCAEAERVFFYLSQDTFGVFTSTMRVLNAMDWAAQQNATLVLLGAIHPWFGRDWAEPVDIFAERGMEAPAGVGAYGMADFFAASACQRQLDATGGLARLVRGFARLYHNDVPALEALVAEELTQATKDGGAGSHRAWTAADVKFVRSKVSPDIWQGCSAEMAGLAPGATTYLEDGHTVTHENGTAPAPRVCFARHPPVWELRMRARLTQREWASVNEQARRACAAKGARGSQCVRDEHLGVRLHSRLRNAPPVAVPSSLLLGRRRGGDGGAVLPLDALSWYGAVTSVLLRPGPRLLRRMEQHPVVDDLRQQLAAKGYDASLLTLRPGAAAAAHARGAAPLFAASVHMHLNDACNLKRRVDRIGPCPENWAPVVRTLRKHGVLKATARATRRDKVAVFFATDSEDMVRDARERMRRAGADLFFFNISRALYTYKGDKNTPAELRDIELRLHSAHSCDSASKCTNLGAELSPRERDRRARLEYIRLFEDAVRDVLVLGLNTGLLVGSFYSSLVRVALQLMPPRAGSYDGARAHTPYDRTLWCSDWECITQMPAPCCGAVPSGRTPFTEEGREELMAPMTKKCADLIGRHSLQLCP